MRTGPKTLDEAQKLLSLVADTIVSQVADGKVASIMVTILKPDGCSQSHFAYSPGTRVNLLGAMCIAESDFIQHIKANP